MKRKIIPFLLVAISICFWGCSLEAAKSDLKSGQENGLELESRDSGHLTVHPYVYRIDNKGDAYLYVPHNWEKKLTNVRAIEGGLFDPQRKRSCNSFYIDNNGIIYEETSTDSWTKVSGIIDAVDIGSSGDNIYAVSSEGHIYKYYRNEQGGYPWFNWHPQIENELIKKVDVDDSGNPWVITNHAKVYTYRNDSWELMWSGNRASILDITCGNGNTYITASFKAILYPRLLKYDFTKQDFEHCNMAATSIELDKTGILRVVRTGFMSGTIQFLYQGYDEFVDDVYAGSSNMEL